MLCIKYLTRIDRDFRGFQMSLLIGTNFFSGHQPSLQTKSPAVRNDTMRATCIRMLPRRAPIPKATPIAPRPGNQLQPLANDSFPRSSQTVQEYPREWSIPLYGHSNLPCCRLCLLRNRNAKSSKSRIPNPSSERGSDVHRELESY